MAMWEAKQVGRFLRGGSPIVSIVVPSPPKAAPDALNALMEQQSVSTETWEAGWVGSL